LASLAFAPAPENRRNELAPSAATEKPLAYGEE
jgi:hypothetical protein